MNALGWRSLGSSGAHCPPSQTRVHALLLQSYAHGDKADEPHVFGCGVPQSAFGESWLHTANAGMRTPTSSSSSPLPPSLPSSPSPQSVDHPETGSSLFCVFPKKTKQNKRRAALPQFLPQEVITESQTNFVPFMFFVHHQHQLKRARLN